jgi:hypothetical protein
MLISPDVQDAGSASAQQSVGRTGGISGARPAVVLDDVEWRSLLESLNPASALHSPWGNAVRSADLAR